MTADRIADALDLLTRAVETHDGAPADTNLARAQVLATIAVAEQLAKLTQAVAAQHGPPAPATHTTSGQAETAPEKTPAPRLMLGDVWRAAERGYWPDGKREDWQAVEEDGQLGLTLGGVGFLPWGEVNHDCGPLTLIERAGYRRTADTAPVWQLKSGQVVSHPDWCDGAPVRFFEARGDVRDLEITCRPLGWISKITFPAARDAEATLWDEIAGGAR